MTFENSVYLDIDKCWIKFIHGYGFEDQYVLFIHFYSLNNISTINTSLMINLMQYLLTISM